MSPSIAVSSGAASGSAFLRQDEPTTALPQHCLQAFHLMTCMPLEGDCSAALSGATSGRPRRRRVLSATMRPLTLGWSTCLTSSDQGQ